LQQPGFGHTRVREYEFGDNRILEAVMPNYSGTRRGENTIVPWTELKRRVPFSERDLHIIEDILRTEGKWAVDPIYVRVLCQRADTIYSPEEEDRRVARVLAEQDRVDRETVRMSCLAQLTRECGIARGDAFMAKANTKTLLDLISDAQDGEGFDITMLIERVMIFAAERSNSSIEDVRDWMDPLVGMIAPFGSVPAAGEERLDGFLFRQHQELLEFRKSLHEQSASTTGELLQSVQMILEVCDQTIAYVNARLVKLDEILGKFADMFDGAEESVNRLKRFRRDVSYGLDGWHELIEIWNEALEGIAMVGGEEALVRAVDHVLIHLPVIPEPEIRGKSSEVSMKQERKRLSLVRSLHSWTSNEVDTDLLDRVKEGRRRAAEEKNWSSMEDE